MASPSVSSRPLKAGKLDPAFLGALLRRNRIRDPRVVLGPGIGRDVAVVDLGASYLVLKSDPITFATESIGWYAVHVNVNDIVTAGARPAWFLATLLLPEGLATEATAERIYDDLLEACGALNVDLIGGHTEVTVGLDRPILAGFMAGEAAKDRLVRSDGARPGDALLMTKRAAVEGTALLGLECSDRLSAGGAGFARRCAAFLRDPGIAVLREAMIACDTGGVHAMHDPTEGGLATGVREMAVASGCGVTVRLEAIPVYAETRRACALLGLDPLGLIASGALLIAADPARAGAIGDAVRGAGIECAEIGRMTERGAPCRAITAQGETDLPVFARDELARLFARDSG